MCLTNFSNPYKGIFMKTYAKKPLLLTIFVTLLVNFDFAQAATHIRLWRGFKQDSSTSAEFRFNVASKLVPATVVVGKDKGLVSYMPVFTNNLSSKPNFIPDEVAIIQYTDEAVYKTLAKTPEFSAYGKMHYDEGFFIKKNQEGFSSGSLVSTPLPQELNLNLEVDSALHYGKVDESWQNDSVDLSILLLKDNDKLACRRIRRHLGILWQKKGCGRPPIPEPVVNLIIDMKRSNLNWGSRESLRSWRCSV
jgi:hypothetical protein